MAKETVRPVWTGIKLMTKLAGALVSLRNGRSAAIRGFKEGLMSQGVPRDVAKDLSSYYPDLDGLFPREFTDVMSRRERK